MEKRKSLLIIDLDFPKLFYMGLTFVSHINAGLSRGRALLYLSEQPVVTV